MSHALRFLRTLVTLVVAAASAGSAGAANNPVQHAIVPPTSRGANPYPFLLSIPKGYESSSERWPLLIFLHGAGHVGAHLWILITLGPPKLIEGGPNLSDAEKAAGAELTTKFIVVSPQCPPGERWDDRRLMALLDFVEAKLKVDVSRVYVTGASMGGYGTWLMAENHADRIAAIVPVCGGGTPRAVKNAKGDKLAQFRRLGVWAFHNDEDPTVPFGESRDMINAFKAIDASDVQFTVYHSNRHDAWTRTYAKVDMYEWLLRHRLEKPRAGGS
jgi:predicted peptidase